MGITPYVGTVISALLSAIVGAIVGALVSKIKTVKKSADDTKRDRDELKKLMKQNIVMTCRMAIYDDHFSVDEKLDAYTVYRDNGGNHQSKTYMDSLVGGDVDEYLLKHQKKE